MLLRLKTASKTCFQIRPPSFSQTHCALFLILSYVPMLSGAGNLPVSAALVSTPPHEEKLVLSPRVLERVAGVSPNQWLFILKRKPSLWK